MPSGLYTSDAGPAKIGGRGVAVDGHEEVDREFAGGAVDHHAWYKTPVVEGFNVLELGELVAAPAHDVGDNGQGQGFHCLLLEEVEINGKFRDAAAKATEVDLVLVFAEVSHVSVLNP